MAHSSLASYPGSLPVREPGYSSPAGPLVVSRSLTLYLTAILGKGGLRTCCPLASYTRAVRASLGRACFAHVQ